MRAAIVFGLAAAMFCGTAAAGEAPTYIAGETVSVAGTKITCSLGAESVTCRKAGGLSVTVTGAGKVRVVRGAKTLFPRQTSGYVGHHVLGPDEGFNRSP